MCLASCPPILADFSSFPWDSFLMEGSHFLQEQRFLIFARAGSEKFDNYISSLLLVLTPSLVTTTHIFSLKTRLLFTGDTWPVPPTSPLTSGNYENISITLFWENVQKSDVSPSCVSVTIIQHHAPITLASRYFNMSEWVISKLSESVRIRDPWPGCIVCILLIPSLAWGVKYEELLVKYDHSSDPLGCDQGIVKF